MKFVLPLFVLLLVQISFAQEELSPQEVQQDLNIFKNILLDGHPALYSYTSPEEWDSIFRKHLTTEQQAKTPTDVYKTICELSNHVGDGHIKVMHPKLDTVPPLFPLLLKIIDGKTFTDTEEFGIPIGSEIKRINELDMKSILKEMDKYGTSDGYNTTKKARKIELEFGFLYFLEYGFHPEFTVEYIAPGEHKKETHIKPESLENIIERNAERNSYFANYHGVKNKRDYFITHIQEQAPILRFIDSLNTAVLTINSFGINPVDFKSSLVEIFKKIRKKKCCHLIIDIRQNIGGYRPNAIHLYTFLAKSPFRQRTSVEIKADYLPEPKYIIHQMSNYRDFLEQNYADAIKEDGKLVLYKDHQEEIMEPNKKTFNGKTYVLIGGNTFSAGSAFALNAFQDPEITLIGEETGGGYYSHTGQYPVIYELPNSRVSFFMSFMKINHLITDRSVPHGNGIIPDIEIGLTQKDLIWGIDTQMRTALELIEEDQAN